MSDDLQAALAQSLRGSYALERELGGGGMARVFLAHETALRRPVVIKVLMPELAAGLSARRFEREIRLAASLQHANIVPVLTAGEALGLPYYVMPFVEGLSVRDRIAREGRLPLERTVGILRDVARALAYAHERGVVHRDIKPDNVLLSGEAAVVTDFGIAKAISAARDGEGETGGATTTVTVAGMMVGTPAYAAPEQVSGDGEIDHRADLYSFGCLAYELLAGAPPFSATSPHALFAEHLMTRPVPIGERCPSCPPGLARLVMQCLEKDPAARPASAGELLQVLDTAITPAGSFDRFRQRLTRRQRAAALLLPIALAAGVVAVLIRGASEASATAGSIAVVPFLNLRPDTAGEYLADGIADGLSTALGKTAGVRVVSRALSYRFRGQRALDAREVGLALSADYLVQGQLRDAGDRLQVSVQLTSADDNSEAWSDSYEGSAEDPLALQATVTRGVVDALRTELALTAESVVAVREPTSNTVAYDLYLRARFLLLRRGPGVPQAIERFEQAVAADPAFAEAHAGLALALQLLPYFAPVEARTLHERTVAAAGRALAADSTLAEAHTALAMAYQHAFQWEEAEARYRRAVALQADEPDVHIQFGRFLWYTGRFEAARTEFDVALRIDRYSAVASAWAGYLGVLSGEVDRGLDEILRALEIDSTNPPSMALGADALRTAGRAEEARALAERLWEAVPLWRPSAATLLARMGAPERARMLIGQLRGADPPPYMAQSMLASLYLSLEDTAQALNALEQATASGQIWPTFFSAASPEFDPLRQSPRFAAILRAVGLDQRVLTSPTGGRPR